MKTKKAFLGVILLILILTSISCGRKVVTLAPVVWTPENALRQTALIPELRDDEPAQTLLDAIDLSLQKFSGLDGEALFQFGPQAVPAARVIDSLNDFRAKLTELGLNEEFFRYVRENYIFYSSAAPQVLFTGYYEPLLHGSLCPQAAYPYPLYGRPADLVTVDLQQYYFYRQHPDLPARIKGRLDNDNRVVPYYSRAEIDFQNKLAERDLEIVWVDSLIDVFFLQIQGSGVVQLDDGSKIFVGYADQNGHPYRSIGKFLLERKYVDKSQLSLQGLREFLQANPEAIPETLNYNPSYVFFQINEQGAGGSFDTKLTPWRSIATDPRLFPPGCLAFIECEKPVFDSRNCIVGWEKFNRFVLNQDSGGAIRGPDRVDLFTGQGEFSELTAGNMKQKGALFFLLKKIPSP